MKLILTYINFIPGVSEVPIAMPAPVRTDPPMLGLKRSNIAKVAAAVKPMTATSVHDKP